MVSMCSVSLSSEICVSAVAVCEVALIPVVTRGVRPTLCGTLGTRLLEDVVLLVRLVCLVPVVTDVLAPDLVDGMSQIDVKLNLSEMK